MVTCALGPAPQGAVDGAGVGVAELARQADYVGGTGLAGTLGAAAAGDIKFGAPGAAVRSELPLQGAAADCQPAGQHVQRGAAMLNRLSQELLEVLTPCRRRGRRQGRGVAAQDVGQARICAVHRQLQVGSAEGDRGDWGVEINAAGPERLDGDPM